MAGGIRLRLWSEADIERLREALPKIANGNTDMQRRRYLRVVRDAGKWWHMPSGEAKILKQYQPIRSEISSETEIVRLDN